MPTPTRPLIWESLTDLTSVTAITANDESATFPASNLGRNGTKDQWSTSNVTGTKSVTWNFGSAISLSAFVMYRHNGTLAGTYRLRLATTQANLTNGSALYDSGAGGISLWQTTDMDVLNRKSFFHSFPSISPTWALLDISDAANPDGKFRAGRAFFGNALQTLYPLVGSDFLSGEDYSILEQSPLGYDNVVPQEPRMDFVKDWVATQKSDAERIVRMWMRTGVAKDIAAVANPASVTLGDLNLGIFRFRTKPRIRWDSRLGEDSGYWSCRLDLKAVI